MTVLAIRHIAFEDLGSFEPVLRARGFTIRYVDAATEDFASLAYDTPAPLFILGGPIAVYDEMLYPFLGAEIGFIEKRLSANLPTFGVCLGAQLMTRALGAKVYPAREKELGWAPIALTDAGKQSVLRPFDNEPVLHWHGDTFDLPNGATRLASTAICENQGYAFGSAALALQSHVEVEAVGLERWYVGHSVEIALAKVSIPALRATTREVAPMAVSRAQACLNAWLDGLH